MHIKKNLDFTTQTDWPAASNIVNSLTQAGYQAVFAGGCVRDALLGRPSKDIDIATNATPKEIVGLFDKTILTGVQFGVVQVVIRGIAVEVATFRTESGYNDGRRPKDIKYSTIEEDALRRDFTINALFYDINEGIIIDLVGGLKDLSKKSIKTVGDAKKRFNEDHLRVLRGIRFKSELGFKYDKNTYVAISNSVDLLKSVSQERILQEINKLNSKEAYVDFFIQIYNNKVFEVLYKNWVWSYSSELGRQKNWNSWEHFKTQLYQGEDISELWFLVSLHYLRALNYQQLLRTQANQDQSCEISCHPQNSEVFEHYSTVKAWLQKITLSKKEIDKVFSYLELGQTMVSPSSFKQKINLIKKVNINLAMRFWKAELCRLNVSESYLKDWSELLALCFENERLIKPMYSGQDLIKNGVVANKEMGGKLDELYEIQIYQGTPAVQKFFNDTYAFEP